MSVLSRRLARISFSPKGYGRIAQGIALGCGGQACSIGTLKACGSGPDERINSRSGHDARPAPPHAFSVQSAIVDSLPRALPWAVLPGTFGARR
jgi:hypothetical protein